MKKNYPQLFSCFKPGFFLVVFLLFGFTGKSQSILNVQSSTNSICQGQDLDFQFTVRNGGGGSVGFDTETIYTIYLFRTDRRGNITDIESFDFTNKQGPPKIAYEARNITHSITVSRNLNAGNNYRLLIISSNPNVPINEEGFSAGTFQIIANNNQVYTETETGTNSWVGHVYDGTNQNQNSNQAL